MNSKMIFQKIRKIDLIKFFKYNFLMPQVKRTKGAYIIPFKGAILEIDKTAEIVLNGTIHFGINHLKGSKAETYIRLAENSKWICKEDVLLFLEHSLTFTKMLCWRVNFFLRIQDL